MTSQDDSRVDFLIDTYDLEEVQPGVFLKETYRSEGIMEASGRNHATSIYYLMTTDFQDRFHRIKTDEIWHYYEGVEVLLTVIKSNGDLERVLLDSNNRQYTIKGGSWYFASLENKGYALVGLVVAPGFIPGDYEVAEINVLLEKFPQHKEIIKSSFE